MCILVVEDDPLFLSALAEALREEELEVLTASDALTAAELVAANPGRLTGLVADYHMPHGMTGSDLIMDVRSLYPDTPILLATGTVLDVGPNWLEEHRLTLTPKPFDADVLAAQFHRSVERPAGTV